MIWGWVLLLGDINVYNLIWNPNYWARRNIKLSKNLIKKFDLLINNDYGQATRPTSNTVSIINLGLSTMELDFLKLWEILKDFLSLSDYVWILYQ